MPDLTPFDQSPRRAFAAMSDEDKAAWHIRYCAQEGAEPRIWVLVERVEREMRAAGEAVTIQSLWVHLRSERISRTIWTPAPRRGWLGKRQRAGLGRLAPDSLELARPSSPPADVR